jgi:hypothetical protein
MCLATRLCELATFSGLVGNCLPTVRARPADIGPGYASYSTLRLDRQMMILPTMIRISTSSSNRKAES